MNPQNLPQQTDIYEISELLMDITITLMGAGAHTSRVIRNVSRIAKRFGYRIDIAVFPRTAMMTITSLDDPQTTRTTIKKNKPLGINFNLVSNISVLSWDTYDNNLSLEEVKARYEQVKSEPRIPDWIVLILVALANMSFCRLFGGDIYAMTLVFIGTFIAFFLRQRMLKHHINHYFIFVSAAFISSAIAAGGNALGIGSSTPDIAVATSVLFLIPGVPLINSLIDILDGHILSGMSRFVNALMLIICIAVGLFLTLLIYGIEKI